MKIYIDGGSKGNPGPGISVMHFQDQENHLFPKGLTLSKRFNHTTNNRAEYEALLLCLNFIIDNKDKLKNTSITIFTDSKLIEGQMKKNWKVNKNQDLVNKSKELLKFIKSMDISVIIKWVPRDQNEAGILIENNNI